MGMHFHVMDRLAAVRVLALAGLLMLAVSMFFAWFFESEAAFFGQRAGHSVPAAWIVWLAAMAAVTLTWRGRSASALAFAATAAALLAALWATPEMAVEAAPAPREGLAIAATGVGLVVLAPILALAWQWAERIRTPGRAAA